jgi:glycosyltransferase involved in cell wall biosynthesis
LISEEYPPFSFGGVGSVCHDLAYALSKRGISTTVLCGRAQQMQIEQINSHLKVVRLPVFDSPPRFIWFQLQNMKLFQKIFNQFSVLHIVNPEAGATAAYIGKKYRKPVILSIHGTYLYPLRKVISSPFSTWSFTDTGFRFIGYPMHKAIYDECLKRSTKIAVCNYTTVAELERLHRVLDLKKVSVIPNAIDFEDMEAVQAGPIRPHSIILYGRLFYVKGAGFLVPAVAQLKKEFPDIHVKIFGNGSYRPKLEQLIGELGVAENVEVCKGVPRAELWKEIKQASIVAAPSLHEAQSVAILEGMAMKKPVIAFDYPFSREVIEPGVNGMLAEPKNVEDLTQKLRTLLSDEKLCRQMGENAYEHVKGRHNWDTVIKKYVDIYEDAIATFHN